MFMSQVPPKSPYPEFEKEPVFDFEDRFEAS